MTQDEFKNLTTEEMLSIARQDYKTTSPDFQQATGLDFSYTTMVNIIKERGYVRSGKQWLPLPKEIEPNAIEVSESHSSDPLTDDFYLLDRLSQTSTKSKLFQINPALDEILAELSCQNKAINISQGALINVAILRLIQDIKAEKVGTAYNLKSRIKHDFNSN